jgi:hypothetical protein
VHSCSCQANIEYFDLTVLDNILPKLIDESAFRLSRQNRTLFSELEPLEFPDEELSGVPVAEVLPEGSNDECPDKINFPDFAFSVSSVRTVSSLSISISAESFES